MPHYPRFSFVSLILLTLTLGTCQASSSRNWSSVLTEWKRADPSAWAKKAPHMEKLLRRLAGDEKTHGVLLDAAFKKPFGKVLPGKVSPSKVYELLKITEALSAGEWLEAAKVAGPAAFARFNALSLILQGYQQTARLSHAMIEAWAKEIYWTPACLNLERLVEEARQDRLRPYVPSYMIPCPADAPEELRALQKSMRLRESRLESLWAEGNEANRQAVEELFGARSLAKTWNARLVRRLKRVPTQREVFLHFLHRCTSPLREEYTATLRRRYLAPLLRAESRKFRQTIRQAMDEALEAVGKGPAPKEKAKETFAIELGRGRPGGWNRPATAALIVPVFKRFGIAKTRLHAPAPYAVKLDTTNWILTVSGHPRKGGSCKVPVTVGLLHEDGSHAIVRGMVSFEKAPPVLAPLTASPSTRVVATRRLSTPTTTKRRSTTGARSLPEAPYRPQMRKRKTVPFRGLGVEGILRRSGQKLPSGGTARRSTRRTGSEATRTSRSHWVVVRYKRDSGHVIQTVLRASSTPPKTGMEEPVHVAKGNFVNGAWKSRTEYRMWVFAVGPASLAAARKFGDAVEDGSFEITGKTTPWTPAYGSRWHMPQKRYVMRNPFE